MHLRRHTSPADPPRVVWSVGFLSFVVSRYPPVRIVAAWMNSARNGVLLVSEVLGFRGNPSGTGPAGTRAIAQLGICASRSLAFHPPALRLVHLFRNTGLEPLISRHSEEIIDVLHRPDIGRTVKPRIYRRKARRDYLSVAKKRKPSAKRLRKAIGKQLRYIARNLNTIHELAPGRLLLLSRRQYRNLLVCGEVYRQQKLMYDAATRTISGRIVSISQPHVRPIVRGKAAASVEFGAKISLSKVEQFVYLDRLSWEPYHESEDLPQAVEAFHRRHGHYPQSVHVDAIYRTRANRRYCRERGIRISGPALGRSKKHPSSEEKQQIFADERARIPIEGALGRGKRAFSLSRLMAKHADTASTSIAMVVLVMNLDTLPKACFLWLCIARACYCLCGPRRAAAGVSLRYCAPHDVVLVIGVVSNRRFFRKPYCS